MIVYHIFFNLEYFFGFKFSFRTDFILELLANFVRFFFIFLVGISSRIIFLNSDSYRLFAVKQMRRFLFLFLASLTITIAVAYFTDAVIWFGILHLISFSVLLLMFMSRFYYLIAFLSVILVLGSFVDEVWVFVGFIAPNREMLDYFPIVPWVFPAILGYYLFDFLYKKVLSKFDSRITSFNSLSFFGKNSLIIYLVHQPIILAFMMLIEKSLHKLPANYL